MKQIVLYLNQPWDGAAFSAAAMPTLQPAGGRPAETLNGLLTGGKITRCLICGDSCLSTDREAALAAIGALLDGLEFDLLVTAPAFMLGQYGVCCAEVCHYVHTRYGIPAVTCMCEENPGVRLYPQDMYIMAGGSTPDSMQADLAKIAFFASKLLNGESILWAEEEGYFPRGIRRQTELGSEQIAARRAVAMLKDKLAGRAFTTELPMTQENHIPIAPAIPEPGRLRLALVTTGGLVPAGNPDHIPCAAANRWGRYSIAGLETLRPGEWVGIDGGLDASYVNADPLLMLPLDALRQLEREGRIGYLHPWFYSTTGNQTNQESAVRMAEEIASLLLADKINAVILISCCGTGTRCGAIMLNELEKMGITAVQAANMVPVSQSCGVNRILKAYSIPSPMADPSQSPVIQRKQRYHLMEKALWALSTPIAGQTVFE